MRRSSSFALPAILGLSLLLLSGAQTPGSQQNAATETAGESLTRLRQSFAAPPMDAWPMMRWWWFGPAVERDELARELRTMKRGGIGGVEIQPVYPLELDDPQSGFHNLRYLSPEFLNMVHFASE